MAAHKEQQARAEEDQPAVELSAVIVAVSNDEPKVLAVRSGAAPDTLPSGPLESRHRTLEAGLRSWVERQTRQTLGYVEQLYTFGDRDRLVPGADKRVRMLSIGYLALVREARPEGASETWWRDWYRYFPWEDRRSGKPSVLARIERRLRHWVADAPSPAERRAREQRVRATFALGMAWSDERVLERYELLYEVGLVPEAHRDGRQTWAAQDDSVEGETMVADHRRVLATAIARLRGKIKYRPVVFELMPPAFTFLQLQRTVEALAGLRLHKANFRRLVQAQGLVEETGAVSSGTGGRPARLLRFRHDVLLERPAPGVRLPGVRRLRRA
ncbi:MAG: hypothetical protein A3I01_01740 [Betaproteobacteria bacterium RIFCSPLOWO2_02_FULL_65_24]|nr:MAG: hypothetical protein A3I01_01740 [Betaproteobacteria bacterium RIFCSPLOWO2_02_FULL_65_24]OGA71576.1 MAG: hypothetical protein A3G27_17955 [Betaproteobacteria bacterium RIFCSPLOWO2_12_FULL_66_14]